MNFTPLEYVLMSTIAATVIPMAAYIMHLHRDQKKMLREQAAESKIMVKEVTHVVANNNQLFDKVFDAVSKISKL